ncbi:MAG: SGNH hydrolase domain-containing protein, partial [Gallionella sp.]
IGLVVGTIVLFVTLWWSFLSYMLVELPAREWDALPSRIFLFQYIVPACLVALLAFSGKHILVSGASMATPSDAMPASAQSAVPADTASIGQVTPDVKVNQATNVPSANTDSAERANNIIKTMSEIDTQLHGAPLPAYQFDYVCQRERITSTDTHNPHCVLGGGEDVPPRVVLWGDSHAAHYIGVVGTIAKAAGFKFRNIELDACPPLMDDPAPYVVAKRLADCRNSSETMLELVRRADVVIISATWSDYFAKSSGYFDATFNTIKQLTSAGKFVIIMGKAPVIMSFDRSCKDKAQHTGLPIDCTFNEPLSTEVISANNQLKSFAEYTPNVGYFDVIPYLCKDGMCSAADAAGNPLYYDAGHLSMPGSWKIGESIVRQEGVPKAFMNVTTWLKKTEQK